MQIVVLTRQFAWKSDADHSCINNEISLMLTQLDPTITDYSRVQLSVVKSDGIESAAEL